MASANLYRSGYLHLFYEDYINQGSSNLNPYSQIWKAKEQIKNLAKARISSRASKSLQKQQEIEEMYKLKEGDFANLMGESSARWKETNTIMGSFDAAIAALKQLIKEKDTDVDYASYLSDWIIQSIDNILMIGAHTNGLSEAAIEQIKIFKNKYSSEVAPHLKWGYYRVNSRNKELLDAIASVQSNISGYMLEIANVYAFLGANATALNAIVNIGGVKSGDGIKVTIDPKLITDNAKLQAAISQNNGTQSKADNILILNMGEGGGSATMISSYLGLQDKNVSDISKVKVGSYTMGQLGIGNYYDVNFLVNTAAGLGHNYRSARSTIGDINRSHLQTEINQGYIDELWANIKNSVVILGVADAVAGELNANITNQVDYYVVRSKITGQTRVISTGEILQNVLTKHLEKAISDNINYNGKGNRKEYWTINYSAFVPDSEASSRPEAAIMRSNKAYSEVLQAIMNTKIKISVDFRDWF